MTLNRSPLFVDAATWREYHARRRAIARQPHDPSARAAELGDLHVWTLDEVRRGHGGWYLVPGPTEREVELVRLVTRLQSTEAA